MIISTIPEQYTGAFQKVIFTIEQALPENIIEVEILGQDGETLGIKRFSGQNKYNVNAGRYAATKIFTKPVYERKTGFINTAASRITEICIKANDIKINDETGEETLINTIESDKVKISGAAECPVSENVLSGNQSAVTIEENQWDEIPFIAGSQEITAKLTINGKTGKIIITVENEEIKEGETGIFLLDTGQLRELAGIQNTEDIRQIELEIYDGQNSRAIIKRKYIIEPGNSGNSVRIAWLNRYGAIDYYTFKAVRAQKVTADKRRVYGTTGYIVTDSKTEKTINAASEPVTKEIFEWISGIVASPKVWIADKGQFTPIDVTTQSVEYDTEGFSQVNIAFRNIIKQILQKG